MRGQRLGNRNAGFGLLEAIAALVIVALMLAMVPRLIEFARRASRSEADLERMAAIAAATELLSGLIAGARPAMGAGENGAKALLFTGNADSVTFVAAAPAALSDGGLAIFLLSTVSAPDETGGMRRDLVATVRPYLQSEPGDSPARGDLNPADPRTAVLVEDAGKLTIRYLGRPARGGDPIWQETWVGRTTLPMLLELTFTPSGPATLGPRTSDPVVLTMPLRLAPPF